MFTVQNLSKSYGLEPILLNVSLSLNAGERWGLVGPNGCGKTTLLRILAGEIPADRGVIRKDPGDLRVGYLPQEIILPEEATLAGALRRMQGDPQALAARLEGLAAQLADRPEDPGLQAKYDDVLARLVFAGEHEGRAAAALAAFGLDGLDGETPVDHLSGGQKTRLALAGLLLDQPQMLLLDEPTNHLDFAMLSWLEDWLRAFPGGILLVSHDRAFLDRVATHILEIDERTHQARAFSGSYTDYLEARIAAQEKQWQAYRDQQAEINRLQQAAKAVRSQARYRKGGKGDRANTDGWSVGHFANRTKEVVQKAKHIERRVERLLTEERVEKPQASWQARIAFGEQERSGKDVVVLENLSAGYDGQAILRDLDLWVSYGERVALTGPNGSGKTTLLRAIAGELPPLAGAVRLGAGVRIGYLTQEQEELDPDHTVLETMLRAAELSETQARNLLAAYLFTGDAVFMPAGKLSPGERARLLLARLAAQGCNLLLLDEPLNHLDIPSRERFERALAGFEGTILAVAHDRYFLQGFATITWEVIQGGIAVKQSAV